MMKVAYLSFMGGIPTEDDSKPRGNHCSHPPPGTSLIFISPRLTSGVDTHVVRLEVPICDVLTVQVPQSKGKLRRAYPALKKTKNKKRQQKPRHKK